jgi:hypothetical protein
VGFSLLDDCRGLEISASKESSAHKLYYQLAVHRLCRLYLNVIPSVKENDKAWEFITESILERCK